MRRRECLGMLGAIVGAGIGLPLVKKRWHHITCAWDCSEYLEKQGIPKLCDSKPDTLSFWFSDSEYFDLSTREGRIAALYAERQSCRSRRG